MLHTRKLELETKLQDKFVRSKINWFPEKGNWKRSLVEKEYGICHVTI